MLSLAKEVTLANQQELVPILLTAVSSVALLARLRLLQVFLLEFNNIINHKFINFIISGVKALALTLYLLELVGQDLVALGLVVLGTLDGELHQVLVLTFVALVDLHDVHRYLLQVRGVLLEVVRGRLSLLEHAAKYTFEVDRFVPNIDSIFLFDYLRMLHAFMGVEDVLYNILLVQ